MRTWNRRCGSTRLTSGRLRSSCRHYSSPATILKPDRPAPEALPSLRRSCRCWSTTLSPRWGRATWLRRGRVLGPRRRRLIPPSSPTWQPTTISCGRSTMPTRRCCSASDHERSTRTRPRGRSCSPRPTPSGVTSTDHGPTPTLPGSPTRSNSAPRPATRCFTPSSASRLPTWAGRLRRSERVSA